LEELILPLLFFKRICDVWDEEHEAMLVEYGEDFADENCLCQKQTFCTAVQTVIRLYLISLRRRP